jgi:hypothetical protein
VRRGSQSTRSTERRRATETCGDCGRVAPGVSRVERSRWSGETERHLCDECREAIVERPLEEVLLGFDG